MTARLLPLIKRVLEPQKQELEHQQEVEHLQRLEYQEALVPQDLSVPQELTATWEALATKEAMDQMAIAAKVVMVTHLVIAIQEAMGIQEVKVTEETMATEEGTITKVTREVQTSKVTDQKQQNATTVIKLDIGLKTAIHHLSVVSADCVTNITELHHVHNTRPACKNEKGTKI